MTQGELFDHKSIRNESGKLRICTKCNEEKALEDFFTAYRKKGGHPGKAYTCIDCKKKLDATVRELRKVHVPPLDSKCECCGDVTNLCLDHDHVTEKFRGWLCLNCNHGLGKFKDNPETLIRAAEYLNEQH